MVYLLLTHVNLLRLKFDGSFLEMFHVPDGEGRLSLMPGYAPHNISKIVELLSLFLFSVGWAGG